MITPGTLNIESVQTKFDTVGYPSPFSDIVALLVFDHQMHGLNLLTRLGWEARVAAYTHNGDLSAGPVRDAIGELVDYLLMVAETPLTAEIRGTSGFAESFPMRGPRDRRGRSLRDLDLKTRLFRYRCSYLIYSAAFDSLMPDVRAAVYGRLWEVLSGTGTRAQYKHLSAGDRQTILEILRDTKTGLPDDFMSK
jgi:hypothetical protein